MIRYFLAYRYGIVAGLSTTLGLFLMQYYQTWRTVFFVGIVWLLVVGYFLIRLERKIGGHKEFALLLAVTVSSFAGLTSLIELVPLRIGLDIMAGVAVFIVFVSATRNAYDQKKYAKQWRRVIMMLWSFAAYGWVTTLFALTLFFPSVPTMLFGVGAALMCGLSAYQLWSLYVREKTRLLYAWAFCLAGVTLQLFLVAIFALPYGYLAMGLLLIWIWYILQLLIRFHLSPKGVIWKKQQTFLIGNAILYILFLFNIVRWI